MTTHQMFDGKLQVYKRGEGKYWQCAARVGGQRFRSSTHEEFLDRAKDVAEEWYLDLRGKLRGGTIGGVQVPAEPQSKAPKERTFREAAKAYIDEVSVLAISSRSPKYVEYMILRMNRHILPFFGDLPLSAINRGLVQTYRVKRASDNIEKTAIPGNADIAAVPGKPPARSTMLQEIVHIRQILKFAEGNGWIKFVPNLSTPYFTQTKRGRRAWFSPEEYQKLYTATRHRITHGKRRGWKTHYEDMHDYVLFMANTGLRPDEAARLQIRDVQIEDDFATRQTILVIDVRGKVGVGYAKSTSKAVHPFNRLKERRMAALQREFPNATAETLQQTLQTTPVFPPFNRDLFNKILEEEGLRMDRDGQRRTAYSLRHTYISNRLLEGASIHMIANNCRTSVQMIEQFYAAHIKDRLDASAINVMRPKRQRQGSKAKPDSDPSNDVSL